MTKAAVTALFLATLTLIAAAPELRGDVKPLKTSAFQIQQEAVLSANPEAVDDAVDGVWHHFLVERLKPYVDSGACLRKSKS
ncbi:MAG: hypothetical protein ACRD59_02930 [Candidatus Acidiferrales bacterium]